MKILASLAAFAALAPSMAAALPVASPQGGGTAVSGCQSKSAFYPWGKSPLERWAFDASQPAKPGSVAASYQAPFTARLIRAYGADMPTTARIAEFEFSDGCRRRFRTATLIPADVARIEQAIARHPMAEDTATYTTEFQPDRATQAALDNGTLGKTETRHFVLWYGVRQNAASYRWVRDKKLDWPTYTRRFGEWLERIWSWDRHVLDLPMPYAGGTDRKRVNIYICGTGLPIKDHNWILGDDTEFCPGRALDAAWLAAAGYPDFSMIAIHEFGHVIEGRTGGLYGKADSVGIWETMAEWNAYKLGRAMPGFLVIYANNLENGPLWSPSQYGAYPFIGFLYDQDRTRPLVWRAWTENQRDAKGISTEQYLPSLVRVGRAAGVYPNGFRSFADDMGWYGARLAAMDFDDQRERLEELHPAPGMTVVPDMVAPLTAGTAADSYVSPPDRPLLEFGTHLIPLTATGNTVEVTLTGETTANDAAWRFAIVAVQNGIDPSYSALGAASGKDSGRISRTVPPGATLYLAVTATPGTYENLSDQQAGPVPGTKFPYRVHIKGAMPLTARTDACSAKVWTGSGRVMNFNYNTNGQMTSGKPCDAK